MVEILFRPLLSKQRLLCSIQAEVGRLLPFVLALLRGAISISNIRKVMEFLPAVEWQVLFYFLVNQTNNDKHIKARIT